MHELYKLEDMLTKELEAYSKSGSLSKTSLDTIDKLAHAAKNVAKVIECSEKDNYSNAPYRGGSYYDRPSYGMDNGYSRANDNVRGQLYKLMEMSGDDRTKDEIRKLIDRI